MSFSEYRPTSLRPKDSRRCSKTSRCGLRFSNCSSKFQTFNCISRFKPLILFFAQRLSHCSILARVLVDPQHRGCPNHQGHRRGHLQGEHLALGREGSFGQLSTCCRKLTVLHKSLSQRWRFWLTWLTVCLTGRVAPHRCLTPHKCLTPHRCLAPHRYLTSQTYLTCEQGGIF